MCHRKNDRWDGWRYHWRQRYQSLGPLSSQYTGKNAGILVEIRNRFFWTLWWKVILKTWCFTTRRRQKLFTEMYHKSYSSPEPQRRSSWQKLALFLLHKLVFIVARVDWCARIWLNVRISLLEKDSSTESKLLSAWGATTIQWNIKMSDYV